MAMEQQKELLWHEVLVLLMSSYPLVSNQSLPPVAQWLKS